MHIVDYLYVGGQYDLGRTKRHSFLTYASRLQRPFLEFLCSRAERAELVDSRTRRRESERRKRFSGHFVQVIAGSDAGADVWTKPLAGLLRNKHRHVADKERVICGVVVCRGERADRPSRHRERRHGGNQFLLQRKHCRRPPYINTGYANLLTGSVIVFKGLQLHGGDVGTGQDLFSSGIDVVEVRRADEPLKQRNMRTVCLIQGESFRVDVEQSSVVGLGVAHHDGVRFQQDVNGRDSVLFSSARSQMTINRRGMTDRGMSLTEKRQGAIGLRNKLIGLATEWDSWLHRLVRSVL